jgi:Cu(I)/Ag(I) efflux system membrane fusion protein
MATVRHDVLESLDWPAMTSQFPVRSGVSLDRLNAGDAVAFVIARGADGLLSLMELAPDDGIAGTGAGIARAVTSDGKLTLEHGPIPELGWPAMTMDLPVVGVDLTTVPIDMPIEFDLAEGEGGLFSIVAVREEGSPPTDSVEPEETITPSAPPIVVTGTINLVNAEAGTATITHGPMTEIGMPGMTMDFPVAEGIEVSNLPVGVDVSLILRRNPDFSMTLLEVALDGSVTQ